MTAQARLKSIHRTLAAMKHELDEYYGEISAFDYGDVDDLAHVDDKLQEIWEFLTEVD